MGSSPPVAGPMIAAAPSTLFPAVSADGPSGPNYSDSPVVVEEVLRKSFAPTGPPNPPDGPGAKPGGRSAISRWGWRALVSFLAGGLIAAAGFAAGEINDGDGSVASPTPSTIIVPTEVDPSNSIFVDADEPAAFVANKLGPSVVQVETDFGLGSGVIYRDGYVLTNNHVVDGAESLLVRLATGENFQAELIGTDASKDLAVLGLGEGRNLPVAELALADDVEVGQIAIAIGSPFQLQQTVTAGIVSAVDRPIPSRTPGVVVAMIQTDAPINPGNSGGALADKNGRVIGINTAIQTDGLSGTNAGVGFAIPIRDAVRIADLLVAGEPIEAGFLGVSGQSPTGGEAGVEIVVVTPDSAAADAGLEIGDRVLSLDGAPVTQIQELAGLVLAHQAGDEVTLKVVREGEEIEVRAVLGVKE
jgi:S1-C subfamily serine protease